MARSFSGMIYTYRRKMEVFLGLCSRHPFLTVGERNSGNEPARLKAGSIKHIIFGWWHGVEGASTVVLVAIDLVENLMQE